jgi:hypothetical protein
MKQSVFKQRTQNSENVEQLKSAFSSSKDASPLKSYIGYYITKAEIINMLIYHHPEA